MRLVGYDTAALIGGTVALLIVMQSLSPRTVSPQGETGNQCRVNILSNGDVALACVLATNLEGKTVCIRASYDAYTPVDTWPVFGCWVHHTNGTDQLPQWPHYMTANVTNTDRVFWALTPPPAGY